MGHRIISQNRGAGGPRYRAPSHRYRADIKHLKRDQNETVKGIVLAIAVGAGTAFLVSYVFQELFLVRLP